MNSEFTSFRLARMSPLIFGLTPTLLALPFAFLASVAVGKSLLLVPALLVIGIYAWVWLRFRPSAFVVRPDAIEVEWPLKRRRIPGDRGHSLIARRRTASRSRMGRARGRRRTVGWVRMVVDEPTRYCADVPFANRPIRLDRAQPMVVHG